MTKDKITTILGMVIGGMVAAKEYVATTPGEDFGATFYMGMVVAVGMSLWAYYTNKPETKDPSDIDPPGYRG